MSFFLFLVRNAPYRNTPPPSGDPIEEYFTFGLFCLQRKHLTYEYFLTFCFSRRGGVSASPKPQAGGHLLSAVRDCLFNLFAATIYIGGSSSIRNLRKRHAVVTGTHQTGVATYTPINDVMFCKFYWFLSAVRTAFFFSVLVPHVNPSSKSDLYNF